MGLEQHRGPGLRVHPPVIYLAGLLVGIGLNQLWPITPGLGRAGNIVGIVLIVLGVAIMPLVLSRFRRSRTPFNPHKPASVLITDGPYRFSRNPAYVALTLWYLGIGLILHSAWVLLLVLPILFVMDRWAIRREEQHLEASFGEEYRRYQSTVRRWL